MKESTYCVAGSCESRVYWRITCMLAMLLLRIIVIIVVVAYYYTVFHVVLVTKSRRSLVHGTLNFSILRTDLRMTIHVYSELKRNIAMTSLFCVSIYISSTQHFGVRTKLYHLITFKLYCCSWGHVVSSRQNCVMLLNTIKSKIRLHLSFIIFDGKHRGGRFDR